MRSLIQETSRLALVGLNRVWKGIVAEKSSHRLKSVVRTSKPRLDKVILLVHPLMLAFAHFTSPSPLLRASDTFFHLRLRILLLPFKKIDDAAVFRQANYCRTEQMGKS